MPNSLRQYWRHGNRAELASNAGISRHRLSDILAGRHRPSPDLAERIEIEAAALGLDLSRFDLLYPQDSDNPLMNLLNIRRQK